jgi:glycosyltransferase involved in cell wall biosynthesis
MWVRFLRSLAGVLPAITVRYACARREVMRVVFRAVRKYGENPYLIFEDIPMACFLPDIVRAFPQMPLALRSHDMLDKAYGPLARVGSPIQRMAWRYESIRMRRFEKDVCERVDKFWAISREDVDEYAKRLSVHPDGVVGVCVDVERYRDVPLGDAKTVVNVGTADLRKGNSLVHFIRRVWPEVRAQIPEARLVLAGRGTERFADARIGVEGLGFVDDDRDVLEKGIIFVNPQNFAAGVQLKSIVAMLAGRALISTPMCVEGVEGRNGQHFIVAESSEEIATQIISLMRDSEHARRIGQQARELAAKTYYTKRFIEDSMPLLEDFIRKTSRGR